MARFSPFKSSWLRRRFKSEAVSPCRLSVESLEDRVVLTTYVPGNPEVLVNATTADAQLNPVSAPVLASGASFVAWQNHSTTANSDDIYLRKVNNDGTLGTGALLVNTATAGAQTEPAVAVSFNQLVVVAWQSAAQDGSGSGIYAQQHNAFGSKRGTEFRVNTTTTGDQLNPSVAAANNGNFVVVWESDGQDGSGKGIFAQRYDSLRNAVGSEFQVNSITTGSQERPVVAMDSAGNFVVAWQDNNTEGNSTYGIYARRFDSNGNALGSDFQVATSTTNQQTLPAIASDASGNFAIAWQSDHASLNDFNIYYQRYDSTGAVVGSETLVNSTTLNSQTNPVLGFDNSGNIVFAWQSDEQDGSGSGVYMRRFDSAGLPSSPESRVNAVTNDDQGSPAIAVMNDGKSWLTYSSNNQVSPTSSTDIYSRIAVENTTPVARTNGPYTTVQGSTVTVFNAESSTDPDSGQGFIYSWDLNGDGVYGDATVGHPSLTWANLLSAGVSNAPGVYNVSVIVADTFGASSTATTTWTVTPNTPPMNVSTTAGPYTVLEGKSVQLRASATEVDPNQNITYSWDINGDGIYGDVPGGASSVTVTWATLLSLGISANQVRNVSVLVTDPAGGTGSAGTTLTTVGNLPPVSVPGGPYSIVQGVGVNLNGSASSDPNTSLGDTLTYTWDVNGDGVFGDSTSSSQTLSWANLLSLGIGPSPGVRNVSLRVTDALGVQTTASTTLTITPNTPPTAVVNGPYSVIQGSSVTFSAAGSSDPDPGQSRSYSWDVNGDGVYGDAAGASPTLTWANLLSLGISAAPDVRNVKVQVTDTFGAAVISSPTTLTVTPNTAPVANANGPYQVTRGSILTVSALGSYDVDPGQTLTYSWDINGDGVFGDATAAYVNIPWTTLSTLGLGAGASTRNIQVRVTDTFGTTTTSSPVVLTLLPNTAPTASAGGPYNLFAGSPLVLNAYGSMDPDVNQTLTYSWDVNGDGTYGDATGANPLITWATLTTLGFTGINESRNIRVQVTDPFGAVTTSAAVPLTVTNTPPVAKIAAPGYVVPGQSTKLSASGSRDADVNQTITVSWDINGDGVYGDATGSTPTVSASQLTALGISSTPGSVYAMRVKVTDSFGVATISDPTTLTVGPNRSPVASAGGPYTVLAGNQLSFDASGSSDPDSSQTLTYSWDINGDGVFDDATGVTKVLTWANFNALGITSGPDVRNIRVRVTDSLGAVTISAPTTLTVNPNVSPIANAGGSYTIVQGASLQLDGSASYDPDGSSVSTSWDLNGDGIYGDVTGQAPLVTWATLTSLGIGPTPGTRTISLLVGGTTIDTATLTIAPNTAPTILSTGGPYSVNQFAAGVVLRVAAVDPDGSQPLSYSWDFGDGQFIFDGENVNEYRLTTTLMLSYLGVSSSTPLSSPITKYIRAKVTDSFGASAISDPIPLTIVPNTAPTANAGGPYVFRQGENISLDASASFDPDTTVGQGPSYSWDVNGDGVFTDAYGIKPTQFPSLKLTAAPGTYNVRVQVSDGKVSTISDPTTLTILPDRAPVANAGGAYSIQQGRSLALDASASTDPDAADKLTYTWDINGDGIYDDATGATPVLNWKSLTALGLGSPGSYSIRLRVEDNYGLQSIPVTATVTILAGTIPTPATPQVLGSFTATDVVGKTDQFVFFTATDSINGKGLWRTDGTAAGTIRLSSVTPYLNSTNTAAVGNYLYFSGTTTAYGQELWRSDGTVAGTGMVKDIWAGPAYSSPNSFTEMNGKLYFTATDALHGNELWTSDGTAAGTTLVKDFKPGPDGSSPNGLVALGNTIYLNANGYTWKSDGTTSGTSYLSPPTLYTIADYYSVTTSSSFYVAGDRLYYVRQLGTDTVMGVYNGLPGAAVTVGAGIGGIEALTVPYFDGKAFFDSSYTMTGNTTTTYFYVDSDNRTTTISAPITDSLAVANGVLYANSKTGLMSLLDGRSNPIIATQNALYMTSSGGSLYFKSDQNGAQQSLPTGSRLWMSDGTPTGTYMVSSSPSSPTDLTAYNDGLVFIANDSNGTARLYSYFDTITLAPIADSTINEGSSLSFNAVASGSSSVYSLGAGAPVGASIDPVTSLFTWTPTDNFVAPVSITVLATDSSGLTDSKTFTVTVNNVAPTLTWTGPTSGLRGEILSFTLSPTDIGSADQAGNFTYNIDWNGDGIDDQIVTGIAGKVVTHAFNSTGTNTVRIKAIDKDGAASASVAHTVAIDSWRLQPNPSNSSLTDLVWSGTSGADSVSFEESGPNQITVHTTLLTGVVTSLTEVFNGVTGNVIAYGQQGADVLDASTISGHSMELRGNGGGDTILGGSSADLIYGDSDGGEGGADSIVAGDGDDVVFADGPEGKSDTVSGGIGDDQIFGDPIQGAEGSADVIDGGDGNDLIDSGLGGDTVTGGSDNDVIVGGKGTDSLTGGSGEDLIIAAGLATSYYAAGGLGLQQLWNQWRTSDLVSTRVAYLTGTPGGSISPSFVLSPGTTLLDDDAIDTVIADDDTDEDWIIANLPQDVIDQTIDDIFTDL